MKTEDMVIEGFEDLEDCDDVELVVNYVVSDIADRAVLLFGGDKIEYLLEIHAAMKSYPEMNVETLLHASNEDFGHDICGIRKNLDPKTKKFKNGFTPKCMQ